MTDTSAILYARQPSSARCEVRKFIKVSMSKNSEKSFWPKGLFSPLSYSEQNSFSVDHDSLLGFPCPWNHVLRSLRNAIQVDLCIFADSRPEAVFSNKWHFELQQVFPFLLRAALLSRVFGRIRTRKPGQTEKDRTLSLHIPTV